MYQEFGETFGEELVHDLTYNLREGYVDPEVYYSYIYYYPHTYYYIHSEILLVPISASAFDTTFILNNP